MSERLYSDIVPLLSNGDPKVRRYALEQMITHIDRLEQKSLMNLFGNSADDDDEEVAKVAKYGLSILFQRDSSRGLSLSGAYKVPLSTANLPSEQDMREVRHAAESVLGDTIKELSNLALDRTSVEMGRYAVQILGRFAFSNSLETLYNATKLDDRADYAIRAIVNFEQEEVLFLLKKFLKRFDDVKTRSLILIALSNLHFPEVQEILEEHASSPSATVRAAVARSLGKWNNESSEKTLFALLSDPELDVVGRAIDSLAILGRKAAGPAIAALTTSEHDKRIRSRASTALGFIRNVDTIPALYRLLEDTDHRVAANAVDSLAFMDLQRADIIRNIGPLVSHPNNRVRANAILLLHRAEEGKAMTALHKMLQSPMRLERASAAYIVGEVGSIDAVRWLVTLINTELESAVLSAALNALEKLQRPEVRPALNRLFRHPNATIRSQAIRVFSKMADSAGMRQLESLLQGEKVQTVRSAIVSAMGNVCDSGNFMVLARLLQDRNDRVVANAIEALDRMGSLEVTPFLTPFLTHEVNRIRANTITALWKLGDLKAANSLYEMVASRSTDARRSAMHVLKQIAGFLQPALLAERPLLCSALKDKFRMRTRSQAGSVTEVSHQFQEIFRMEEEFTQAPTEPGVPSILRERALGDEGQMLKALTDTLTADPKAPFALYFAHENYPDEKKGRAESNEELRKLWQEAAFLPGLLSLLEKSKAKKDLRSFLADYLALFEGQMKIYEQVLERCRNLLAADDNASVQQMVKFLVEKMPLQPNLHRELGELAFATREHDLAYDHYLRAYLRDKSDHDAALKLCSSALRRGDKALAASLVDILLGSPDVSDEIIEKAKRFKTIMAKEE